LSNLGDRFKLFFQSLGIQSTKMVAAQLVESDAHDDEDSDDRGYKHEAEAEGK